jgi:hypothetical protein
MHTLFGRYLFRFTLGLSVIWFLIVLIFLQLNDPTKNFSDTESYKDENINKHAEFNVNPRNAINFVQKIFNYESNGEQSHAIHDNREQVIAPNVDDKKINLNGLGEMGKPVEIDKDKLSPSELKKYNDGFSKHAFNEYVSDLISKHRSLPDIRDSGCRQIEYKAPPITASIVMCLHNEAWSTLLRSIHSVIDRSPSHLLKEIILVDDFSDMGKQGFFFFDVFEEFVFCF